jgi:hypothetical protein
MVRGVELSCVDTVYVCCQFFREAQNSHGYQSPGTKSENLYKGLVGYFLL